MHDLLNAEQRATDGVGIADIGAHQFDFLHYRVEGPVGCVDLLDETVENPDLVTSVQECAGEMTADEAGPSGDEHPLHYERPSPR